MQILNFLLLPEIKRFKDLCVCKKKKMKKIFTNYFVRTYVSPKPVNR